MTTAVSPLLGRPVWYELMTTDPAAAEKFYDAVVGWTSAPFAGSPNPYTVFSRAGNVQVAGLMKTPPGMNMPPFWSMYIAVPKLEETEAQIKKLGGRELSGVIEVPSVGRMRMMKDPQGAAFYIIEPDSRSEGRPEGPPEVGEGSWHELMTTDATSAMSFYQQIFGWQDQDTINVAVLGLPAGHPLAVWMLDCWKHPDRILPYDSRRSRRHKLIRRLRPGNSRPYIEWGEFGPRGFTQAVRHLGYESLALPFWHFYPIHYLNWLSIFDGSLPDNPSLIEASVGLHLWNEMTRRRPGFDKNARFPPDSLFEQLCARYLKSDS